MRAERFQIGEAEILVGADVNETARIVAGHFATAARNAAANGTPFFVALSGGNSPRPFFQMLSADPFRKLVPWEALRVFWGDERNVPPHDPASNYGMARELLLAHVPVPPAHIHRIPTGDGTATEAADLYERTVRDSLPSANGLPRLDYNLLGLGANCHTASLFPHRPTLHERQRLVVADHVDDLPPWRVTLTLPVLNNSAQITFLVTGKQKAEAVHRVLRGPRDPDEVPAQLIAPTHGSLTWILDAAAASLLSRPDSQRAAS